MENNNGHGEYGCYAHDVLFGMSYEFINRGDKLLDLGTGSGLSSGPFLKAGLKVYGLDSDIDVLKQQKAQNEELIRYDISKGRLPFRDQSFSHVVCCGVFHFLNKPDALFSEVGRIVMNYGIFSFTVSPNNGTSDFTEEMTPWGITTFRHSPAYIQRILEGNNMRLIKEQRLLFKGADKTNYDQLFSALVARVEKR